MKNIKLLIILALLSGLFSSCEEYEDYIQDYAYTGVYFGSQKPLRTIVARENMQFRFGVVLAGKRENNTDEWVKYEVDAELLNTTPGADVFTLLPEAYYSLSSDSIMIIPKGSMMGDVTVTLNRGLFTSDPDAHLNTYALPLKLIETSADTILEGNEEVAAKDYSIIVVKYISPNHGFYYHKGTQQELDGTGAVVNEVIYNKKDLSQNAVWGLSTVALNSVATSGAGNFSGNNDQFLLTVNADNTVAIESAPGSDIAVVSGSGQYDKTKDSFYLQYQFNRSGVVYNAKDTLVIRQAPEMDLRFEEW